MSQNYLKIWGLKQFGAKWDNSQQYTVLRKADWKMCVDAHIEYRKKPRRTIYDRLEGEWDFTEPQFIKPFYHLPRQIPTLLTPPISTLASAQYRSKFRVPCKRIYDYRSKSKTVYLHYHHKKLISESESDQSCEEEQDVARRRLDEALIEKKKTVPEFKEH
ncbi:hypothetical protein OUZ56_011587 [Daphnia magna]|uniref:Uncharacterized protein n=1 Tax=Daphnia magna TaxID=35525 RepID=A0ABQ9Z0M6_9CRUS|nr:hypothetical protein OUZ56_011587 [Daphnia magna]